MEEILHHFVDSLSYYSQSFIHPIPGGCLGFFASTVSPDFERMTSCISEARVQVSRCCIQSKLMTQWWRVLKIDIVIRHGFRGFGWLVELPNSPVRCPSYETRVKNKGEKQGRKFKGKPMGLSQALMRGMLLFLGEPQPLRGIFFFRVGDVFLSGGRGRLLGCFQEKIQPSNPWVL